MLASVYETSSVPTDAIESPFTAREIIDAMTRRDAYIAQKLRELQKSYCDIAEAEGVPCRGVVEETRSNNERLCAIADNVNSPLLVVGSRGLGRVKVCFMIFVELIFRRSECYLVRHHSIFFTMRHAP